MGGGGSWHVGRLRSLLWLAGHPPALGKGHGALSGLETRVASCGGQRFLEGGLGVGNSTRRPV